MKLTIPQRDLATVIKHTVKAVERRNTIPILSNILLSAKANKLSIKATDLDIEVTTSIACEVARPGDTTVPAHMLDSIVGKLKDSAIILEQDANESNLQVRASRSRFKLQTLPVSDFPDLAIREVTTKFEMPMADLLSIFDADFCISTEETRYYLNGIFLHHHGDKLRGVATDGHRLAQIECAQPAGADKFGNTDNPNGVIVPRKTVKLILAILKDNKVDKIGVQMSDSKIVFTLGGVVIASKLINGTFPDYERVVPNGNNKIVTCERAELEKAVDRIASISSERGKAAKFSLEANKLTLSIVNPDAGSAIEEMEAEYTGDPLEVGFNSVYATEILSKVTGDKVEMRLADPGSPALISSPDRPTAKFVLMPMRV